MILFSLHNLFAEESNDEAQTENTVTEITGTGDSSAALPPGITAIEVQAFLGTEYNRSNYNNGKISLIAGIEFIDLIALHGGFLYGQSAAGTDLNSFLRTRCSPFSAKYLSPLSFGVSYIYNGIPEYEVKMHSILPFVSYAAERAGISFGCSLRFTSFFEEKAQFESVLSFYGYVNFVMTETFVLGIGGGTFDDFNARNMAAIWFNLNANINLNKSFSIYNEIGLMQSGMDGLTATFYGFAWRGGVKYVW